MGTIVTPLPFWVYDFGKSKVLKLSRLIFR